MSIGKSYPSSRGSLSKSLFNAFAKQKIDVNANLSTMDEASDEGPACSSEQKTSGVTYAKNCFPFAVAGGD
jgi:hypothetical protein